jgi:hypothetical protein
MFCLLAFTTVDVLFFLLYNLGVLPLVATTEMMQEHRSLIKRASAWSGEQLDSASIKF